MSKWSSIFRAALACSFFAASGSSFAAYVSGSTGADGAFSPTASQSIQLPPDGIFNYSSVNIPTGVTITYIKNAANTPVYILVSGNATIAGTLDVSATQPTGTSDSGIAGPGGYNGGRGGQSGGAVSNWVAGYTGPNVGRAGIGPGGGAPGTVHLPSSYPGIGPSPDVAAGGGGAYGGAPPPAGGACPITPGVTYGNAALIPLLGGSGGGGGAGGPIAPGSGGGGGGGAVLIAVSGTLSLTGSILANGGTAVSTGTVAARGAYGGGGSGGAIRLIATTFSGNGTISAVGGSSLSEVWSNATYGNYGVCSTSGSNNSSYNTAQSQYGGDGRIRIEAETLNRTTSTTPPYVGGSPNLVFVPGAPTLRIDTIGGITVPAVPSGISDVVLPSGTVNPVTITFITSGVTVGSLIKLTVNPVQGVAYSATSAATTGTTSSATTSVTVSLPSGTNNTLQASVTYTVVASIGDAMGVYAQNERVEKVTLATTLGSSVSTATLTTVSGKEYVVPASVLAAFAS